MVNLFTFLNKGKGAPPPQKNAKKEKGRPGSAPSVQGTPGVVDANKTAPQVLAEGMLNIRDIIAPSAIEVDFSYLKIGQNYYRTIFISGYPRFVGANWLSQIINFEHSLDISMFYYPVKARLILDDLRRKITELEATELADREKGRVTDPVVRAALEDAQALQEQLVKGVEKYFQFSFYITISAKTLEELNQISSQLESTLGALLLISKPATLQMEEAFQSTIPCASDKLLITRNMDTTSLATTFPFTSSDLTSDEGIMYGINMHNGSLVVFDRFSMENANTVVFAKSGSGKSYFVKLEALRLMVFGAEVMIIDPEEEYRTLCEAVGGNYIDFSPKSTSKINPFDLSNVVVEGENELSQKLLSLFTLMQLMLGDMNPTEEVILDRALIETYRIKGITKDPESQMNREPPVMEDLYKVLRGAQEPEAKGLADRLEKYIRGSMAGIFDSQSTINLGGIMTVFSTKQIEDEILRPVAFYMILDFVWTKIRRDLKRRILIVEEAWYLMKNEDSARFIYGVAKRARKYYLGLTTISQDVDDFLTSEHGRAIVTNSSIQVLLKQHPAAIDKVAKTFYLSEGERRLLLAANIGEGLFFAGSNHVAIQIKASPAEHKLITTDPEEILRLKEEGIIKSKGVPQTPVYKPIGNINTDKFDMLDAEGNPKVDILPKPPQPDISQEYNTPPVPMPPPTVIPKPTQTDAPKNDQPLGQPTPLGGYEPPVSPTEPKVSIPANTPPLSSPLVTSPAPSITDPGEDAKSPEQELKEKISPEVKPPWFNAGEDEKGDKKELESEAGAPEETLDEPNKSDIKTPAGLPPLPKEPDTSTENIVSGGAKPEEKGGVAKKIGAGLGSLLGFKKSSDDTAPPIVPQPQPTKKDDSGLQSRVDELTSADPEGASPLSNVQKRPQMQPPPRTEKPQVKQPENMNQVSPSGVDATGGMHQNSSNQSSSNQSSPQPPAGQTKGTIGLGDNNQNQGNINTLKLN